MNTNQTKGYTDFLQFNKPIKAKNNYGASLFTRVEWANAIRTPIYDKAYGKMIYTGLPDYIPLGIIERNFVHNGHNLAFNDKKIGPHILTGSYGGQNLYNQPTDYTVVSPKFNKTFKLYKDDCAIGWNNYTHTPDSVIIEKYVSMMVELLVSYGINQMTLRQPYILEGNEKTKQSLIESYNQLTSGVPFIMIDEALKGKANSIDDLLKVHDLKVDSKLNDLFEHFIKFRNELYTQLGIQVVENGGKKERMIVDEANAMEEVANSNLLYRYETRKAWVDEINRKKLFPNEIGVEINKNEIPLSEVAYFEDNYDNFGEANQNGNNMAGTDQEDNGV